MRLNSIKLAGFKSFVDPTHIAFQSNLTAIVGPNGCGKSNIIDAIYCVLGSTSKNLRADMMSDVIFNGTSSRKPVAQAGVELVFDNSSGRIGGEYAQYPEISIRRELNRDGQSNYFINGTRCRRRDITDIFLGTGLGQNSYAIIEQGMISRLIEAKPEELRAHVEEAAGTSKYKERRRETENRIKHTRENLDRLNDIREEQEKQLNHLQKQANAAERYKTLKAEQRLLKAQLQAILCNDLNKQIASYTHSITEQETLLEAKISNLRTLDKEIEANRSLRGEHTDIVNEIQGEYYTLGSEVSRIEQLIAHSKERKRQLENDYEQLEVSYQELTEQNFEDQQQTEELSREVSNLELGSDELQQIAKDAQVKLKESEQIMHNWQEQWDDFNHGAAQTTKQIEVEKTRIQHLEQKYDSLQTRITRIQDEQTRQNNEELIQELEILKRQKVECQLQLESLQERLSITQENILTQRNRNHELNENLGRENKQLRELHARYTQLEALQQIALGKNDTEMKEWLQQHHLENKPRLAEGLQVEKGWEVAVETVLAHYLDAICVEEMTSVNKALEQFQNGNICIFNINAKKEQCNSPNSLPKLVDKMSSNWPINNILKNIYTAENLNEAMTFVSTIESHESIITRNGIWLNGTWVRVSKSINEKTGVLQREQELKELQNQISQHQNHISEQEQLYHEAREQLQLLEEEKESLQQRFQEENAKYSDISAQSKAKETLVIQLQQKQESLLQELHENQQSLLEVENNLNSSRSVLESASQQTTAYTIKREELIQNRDSCRTRLEEARDHAITTKQKADETQVRLESMRSQIHFLNQNIIRAQRQIATTQEKRSRIEQLLSEINDPLPELTTTLQQALEKRSTIETNLTTARHALETLEINLQNFEKNRQQIENEIQNQRTELEHLRLNCQSLKVKHASHFEQIEQNGFSLEGLSQELSENAAANEWEEKILRIENRIQRLGAINLAAIDEYSQLLERKQYLDKQNDDLMEALATLENAIRKIDRETRIRFKETFTQLNNFFKTFFTEIFSGGEANLELTSDDLLETGVIVKAQPPGKRNSTIHLLSGGEKALTAIALVFAIFNLNPAPFCVMDEVDAPLDDINVGRFCNLVKKMSEKIQFIFISHNKITIEMGQQLAGITMNEPGVSRIVSVDIDEAISMATT